MTKNESDWVLGIMSGSSLDGLDLAVCKIGNQEKPVCKLIHSEEIPIPQDLKQKLSDFHDLNINGYSDLNVAFTKFVAQGVQELVNLENCNIDYISFHGHTLIHKPGRHYSLQLGNGGLLSALSGLPVICDFRSIDVGLGGTGAPLAPLVDKILYSNYDFSLNLGGIANITSLSGDNLIAFDICPCNQILNWLSSFKNLEFDDEGKLAATGEMNKVLFEKLDSIPFQNQAYPKSLDNEWIKSNYRLLFEDVENKVEDSLFTFTVWIAKQIQKSIIDIIKNEGLKKESFTCLLAGGGAKNTFLVKQLEQQLQQINGTVALPDHTIIDFKEAILMSLLGYCRKYNIINTFKDVTGARVDSIGGAIYQGTNKLI